MHGNLETTKQNVSKALGPLRSGVKALYAKSPIKGGKLGAILLVLLAVVWIGSGMLLPHQEAPAATATLRDGGRRRCQNNRGRSEQHAASQQGRSSHGRIGSGRKGQTSCTHVVHKVNASNLHLAEIRATT